jgi:hypothetical protein
VHVAPTASERQTSNARLRHNSQGSRQAERLRLSVKLTESQPGLRTSSSPGGIDAYAFHEGKINHEASVANRFSSDAVASTPNRNNKVMLTGKTHARYDISGSCTPCDECRSPINHRVRKGARCVVTVLARAKQRPAQLSSQSVNCCKLNHVSPRI